jgi:hypothetical protein
MKTFSFFLFALFSFGFTNAQLLSEKEHFTRQDTLRGSITPEREWWDLTYYHLDIKVDPDHKFISGKNTIQYKVLRENTVMQIDLQPPMKLLKAVQNGKALKIKHNGNAHFISLADKQNIDSINRLTVYYEGHTR